MRCVARGVKAYVYGGIREYELPLISDRAATDYLKNNKNTNSRYKAE